MSRLFALVKREYLERVRTKAFVIGTVLGPVFMVGITILPGLLMARGGGKPLRVSVVDAGGTLRAPVEAALAARKVNDQNRFLIQPPPEGPSAEQEAKLKDAVLAGTLDGFLVLPEDVLAKSEAAYYGKNVSNMVDLGAMESAVSQTLVGVRLTGAGIPADRIKDVTKRVEMKRLKVSAEGNREDRGAATMLAIILMMILYTSVLIWGQLLLTSVIEEKTSRVVEVMVSAVTPCQLLLSKLLGVGAAGLTQFLVWVLSLVAVSAFGAGMAAAMGNMKLPEVSSLLLVSLVVFFLLGFLLYSALFAAVGSSVNSQQEASSLAFPVMMPLIVGVMLFPLVMQAPDGTAATVLSFVPFLTPLIMFLRIAILTPPWWQIALSILTTSATIAGVLWVASRIYRVGILMYGKKPTFPELVRWVRHS